MSSVIITFPDYQAVGLRLLTMTNWCHDNAGVEYKDWQWRSISRYNYDFEFTFKKNKVATMFALNFLQ